MIFMRRLARERDAPDRSMAATVLGNALAFVACLPFLFPLAGATASDALALVYLGTVQIGFAYWLFVSGLRELSAVEVSLLVLVEPVLNPLWTWLLHG